MDGSVDDISSIKISSPTNGVGKKYLYYYDVININNIDYIPGSYLGHSIINDNIVLFTKDEIKDGFRAYEYDYDYDDDAKLTDEQYKKRKTGTIISMVLLTLLIVANAIALIVEGTADVTIVLLGLAISITAIITSMGIKFGKFYTVCAIIINLLLVFIITSLDLTTGLGYIISYAVVIVVLLYYYFSKVFERILPMFNYVPAVVAIVGIGFVGLTNVFAITNWWVSLILVVLLVAGYFAYNYYGIASLEEQAELEKQKGLNVYDYFNLRTNKVDWKNKNISNQVDASINTANKNGNKFVTKELDEKKDDIKNFFK
jgi:flagellar basal body-associated protein FliL